MLDYAGAHLDELQYGGRKPTETSNIKTWKHNRITTLDY